MTGIDRRTLMVAGGAGVGLIVAFSLWPRRIGSALKGARGEQVFGHYLRIAPDGRVTVAVPQAETGQGIWTGLAQIAADELGAAWEQVAVEPAPASPVYANPAFKRRLTAGATSIREFEKTLREAGAMARDLLIRAAAKKWDADPAECNTADGFVTRGGQRLALGALAEAAARLEPAKSPAQRPIGGGRLAGRSLARLDLPPKSDGSLRFAADVRLPGMLFASARLAPPGGRLVGFSRAAAEKMPGVRGLVVTEGWVAALGDNWWAAERALEAAGARFIGSADASDSVVDAALQAALDSGEGEKLFERGDYEKAVGGGRALAATYRVAAAEHFSLEPLCATARFFSGRLEVWAPVQAYDDALAAASKAGGIGQGDVILYPMPVGDNSGRAIEADAIPIAVDLARRARHPVQLTIPAKGSRNHDRPRPPMLARMTALPSADGGLAAWSATFATAPGLEASLARLDGKSGPKLELPGAVAPYAAPSMRVRAVSADLPMACGYMRGGSEALTAFANESFIDEMARALNAEPFSFRMGLLGGNVRLARVLDAVATLGGWDGGGPGSRLGLAAVSAFGSHIALLADAGIGPDQRVMVERLVAVVDCGRAINPGLVIQQVEGSLFQALSLATASAPEIVAGMPVAHSMRASGLTGVARVPNIRVEILPSRAAPGGASGLGHVVLPAAVANALAAATGRRLRSLPFDPMAT